jgi:hypothetical protein
MLTSLPAIDLALWAATALTGLVLFVFIFKRNLDREFPFLTLYLGVNLLQTVAQLFVYQFYGFESNVTYVAVWGSQVVVIVARALAACEFCYRVLGHYTGVWALAIRILVACGAIVLGLTAYFCRDGFYLGVIRMEIASEAFIATIIAGTAVFARYYEAPVELSAILLGFGLGLNSCLKMLNDAVISRYWEDYSGMWNEVGMVAFMGVLVLWIFAMRAAESVSVAKPELQGADVYHTLAPQMNRKLAELNDELIRLFKPEQPKP